MDALCSRTIFPPSSVARHPSERWIRIYVTADRVRIVHEFILAFCLNCPSKDRISTTQRRFAGVRGSVAGSRRKRAGLRRVIVSISASVMPRSFRLRMNPLKPSGGRGLND